MQVEVSPTGWQRQGVTYMECFGKPTNGGLGPGWLYRMTIPKEGFNASNFANGH